MGTIRIGLRKQRQEGTLIFDPICEPIRTGGESPERMRGFEGEVHPGRKPCDTGHHEKHQIHENQRELSLGFFGFEPIHHSVNQPKRPSSIPSRCFRVFRVFRGELRLNYYGSGRFRVSKDRREDRLEDERSPPAGIVLRSLRHAFRLGERRFIQDRPEDPQRLDRLDELVEIHRFDHVGVHPELVTGN